MNDPVYLSLILLLGRLFRSLYEPLYMVTSRLLTCFLQTTDTGFKGTVAPPGFPDGSMGRGSSPAFEVPVSLPHGSDAALYPWIVSRSCTAGGSVRE